MIVERSYLKYDELIETVQSNIYINSPRIKDEIIGAKSNNDILLSERKVKKGSYDRFNKLYNQDKVYREHKKELISKILTEQGVTFSPKLNDYRLKNNSGFLHRNNELLERKQNSINKQTVSSLKDCTFKPKIIPFTKNKLKESSGHYYQLKKHLWYQLKIL